MKFGRAVSYLYAASSLIKMYVVKFASMEVILIGMGGGYLFKSPQQVPPRKVTATRRKKDYSTFEAMFAPSK